MTLRTLVTFQPSSEITNIHFEDYEILDTLGKREEAIAVKLKELLSSVTEAVREGIESEGELSVEISGAIELKASAGAGVQYLLFNIGADASKTSTMKVTFKTKVTPKSASS